MVSSTLEDIEVLRETPWSPLLVAGDDLNLHNLPFPFIAASTQRFKELYGWDSKFVEDALLQGSAAEVRVAAGQVKNSLVLIDRLGYVPNSNLTYSRRAHPPFTADRVWAVYSKVHDVNFLHEAIPSLLQEREYWRTGRQITQSGLSRYHDDDNPLNDTNGGPNYGAVQTSGWDNGLRFQGVAHEVNPVDLNSFLVRNDMRIAQVFDELRMEGAGQYRRAAQERAAIMQELMWDPNSDMFFDYHDAAGKQLDSWTVAAYAPLWAGVATERQADELISKLQLFEGPYGLAVTLPSDQSFTGQWSNPNVWVPTTRIAEEGVLNFSFGDAQRLHENARRGFRADSHGPYPEKWSAFPDVPRKDDERPGYDHQEYQAWTLAMERTQIGQDPSYVGPSV